MKHFLIGLAGWSLAGLALGLAGGTVLSFPWFILIAALFIIDMNAYIKGRAK